MTRVRSLLEEFRTAFEGGRAPNPRHFLDRVEGVERRQLEAAIDRFLIEAPRRPAATRQLATSPGRRVADSLERSLTGQAGLWPSLLPRLRSRNRLRRGELVSRLAAALGSQGQEAKIGTYYHEMEQGKLPATGVSNRVLDALGAIMGESADRLRAAGQAFDPMPPQGGRVPRTAFARTSPPSPIAADRDRSTDEGKLDDSGWDDVDRLFRGG